MKAARWLKSPLAATAAVMAGLCLVAIPMRALTSGASWVDSVTTIKTVSAEKTPAVLRIKLLAPATRLVIKTVGGVVLLDRAGLAAGDSEYDASLDLSEGDLELSMMADFGETAQETAVFLTVVPDEREEQTRYATGSGLLEEILHFTWPHEP